MVVTLHWIVQFKCSQALCVRGNERNTIMYLDADFMNRQLPRKQEMVTNSTLFMQNIVTNPTTSCSERFVLSPNVE